MTIRIKNIDACTNSKGDLEQLAIGGTIEREDFRGVLIATRNGCRLIFIKRSPIDSSIIRYHLSQVVDENECLVSNSYGAVNIGPKEGYYPHYNSLLRKLESGQHGRKRK